MLIEAAQVGTDTELVADVCIVGAGPAGIAISLALIGSGLSVILLESGGLVPSARAQRLYAGEAIGHDYFRLDGCRYRMFGGSTNRWGGWSRPLEPDDFAARDWIADSGWPITAEDLERYHPQTAKLLELSTPRFDLDYWLTTLPEPFSLDKQGAFQNAVFQYSPQTNFGSRYRPQLEHDPDTRVIVNATVIDLRLAEASERVELLRVASFSGTRFTVRAAAIVLACGGLENPRLLLAATSDRPAGLGNQHDNVGRYFMEHLHVPAGHLAAGGTAALPTANGFYLRADRNGIRTRGVLVPTAAAQREAGLAACSIAIEDESYSFGTPFVGWHPRLTVAPVRLLAAAAGTPLAKPAKRARDIAELAYNRQKSWHTGRVARRIRQRRPSSGQRLYSLYFRTEQQPNRNSRIALTSQRDEFGTPRIALDWRLATADLEVVPAWLDLLAAEVRDAEMGEVIPPADDWADQVIGGPHHLGTTRMSDRPASGVVDRNCKVHDVANLYVAGSSVFTTGGYANPTFSLLSLALRLADHLRAELRGS